MDIAFGISYNVRTNETIPGAAATLIKAGVCALDRVAQGTGQASPLLGKNSSANLFSMRLYFQVPFPTLSKYRTTQ